MQFLIAINQTVNTLVWLPGDGFGMADETLSARAYRLRIEYPWIIKTIDTIFFWDKEHCRNSYISEVLRRHLPEVFSSYCKMKLHKKQVPYVPRDAIQRTSIFRN